MALSEAYVDGLIKKWMKSSDGKSELKKRGITSAGYSLEQMKDIGEELKNMLCNAIINVGIKSFASNLVQVDVPASTSDSTYTVHINFPDEILKRKSLWTGYSRQFPNKNGRYMGYSGDSVYDIVGLFSRGWQANGQVFGYWVGHNNDPYCGSRVYKAPDSFIGDTITRFNAKYPEINILYPSLWGGTL